MDFLMFVLGSLFLAIGCGDLHGASPSYSASLSIHFNAPGILGYAVDSFGNESGTDPNISLDTIGQQQVNGEYYDLIILRRMGIAQARYIFS
jgi:hypothetical protein